MYALLVSPLISPCSNKTSTSQVKCSCPAPSCDNYFKTVPHFRIHYSFKVSTHPASKQNLIRAVGHANLSCSNCHPLIQTFKLSHTTTLFNYSHPRLFTCAQTSRSCAQLDESSCYLSVRRPCHTLYIYTAFPQCAISYELSGCLWKLASFHRLYRRALV